MKLPAHMAGLRGNVISFYIDLAFAMNHARFMMSPGLDGVQEVLTFGFDIVIENSVVARGIS